MLSSATLEPKDPAESTTKTYTRDQYGNVTSTTITGQGIPPITTSVKYDPKGRFIIQQTNALNKAPTKQQKGLRQTKREMAAKTTIDYEPLSGKKIQIYTKEHNAVVFAPIPFVMPVLGSVVW